MPVLTSLKLTLSLYALFAFSGCSIQQSSKPPVVDPINVIDLNGKTRALEDYLGSPTLLVLWASWCPECLAELGTLNSVTRQLTSKGVQLITVAIQDDLDSVRSIPQTSHALFPVLIDIKGEVLSRYPADGLPSAYLLGPEGDILPLIDPEDGQTKSPVVGLRSWQSRAGQKAVFDSFIAAE